MLQLGRKMNLCLLNPTQNPLCIEGRHCEATCHLMYKTAFNVPGYLHFYDRGAFIFNNMPCIKCLWKGKDIILDRVSCAWSTHAQARLLKLQLRKNNMLALSRRTHEAFIINTRR